MNKSVIAFVAVLVAVPGYAQSFGSPAIDRSMVDLAHQITFIDAGHACPSPGKISSWSLFAKGTGDVVLQMWRPMGGGVFKLIGANSVSVPSLGLNTFNIAGGDQISVEAGDFLGFRYNQTTFGTRIIAFDQNTTDGMVWTNWPDDSTNVAIGGTVSGLVGANERRAYSINAMVTPVPEPASLVAIAVGGALLARRRR